MNFVDFHTHHVPPEGVTALVSGASRPERGFFSRQCLPGEFTGSTPDLTGADAIGEIGLDRRLAMPMQEQRRILRLLLAAARDLPAVIHCVRAGSELDGELARFRGRVLLHRFSGSPEEAERQLALGRMLSFRFRDADRAAAVWRRRPELLALESDDDCVDYHAAYASCAAAFGADMDMLAAQMAANLEVFLHGRNI